MFLRQVQNCSVYTSRNSNCTSCILTPNGSVRPPRQFLPMENWRGEGRTRADDSFASVCCARMSPVAIFTPSQHGAAGGAEHHSSSHFISRNRRYTSQDRPLHSLLSVSSPTCTCFFAHNGGARGTRFQGKARRAGREI